jgi:L-seryl-tRNA(Ser) seleniumtransferase
MSGDKLLGGPQAGIIVGSAEFVEKLRQNPLRRAVRVDKVTIAALQSVLRDYLFAPDPVDRVPALARIFADPDRLRERAQAVVAGVASAAGDLLVVDDEGAVGGGSLASVGLPSVAIAVRCAGERDAVELARRMRLHEPPLFPRVRGREVRVNMLAIAPDEDEDLRGALVATLTRRES